VREQTGLGQSLDSTIFAGLEATDYMVSIILQLMAKRGEPVDANTRGPQEANRYGVLVATKDGRFIQTSTMLPHQARALCEVAGITSQLDHPRFARAPMFDNAEIAQEFEDMLIDAFRAEDLSHWLPLLIASPDIAFEVSSTSEQSLDHPQIVHNGDVITIDDPVAGPVRQVGPIAHFEKTPVSPARSAPALGQHDGDLVPGPRPAGGGEEPRHPFSGVTVVEFGYFYAMPYGVKLLASLGARVIKIEDGNGDPHRRSFGPEVASTKTTAGKESVSVDLSTPEGRAFAQRIAASADVFVSGFRSGIAEKLGLGYDELRAFNPRLVYLHAAGYGSDGPYARRALYAQAAQAVGGSFGRQVGYWADPELNRGMSRIELQAIVFPRLNQVIDGDSNAALAVLAALALAVYHQRRTGEGQLVRTSMIAANALTYSDDFCAYEGKQPVPLCDDEYYGLSALERLYEAAKDSWVCIAVKSDAEFARLASALGLPELLTDTRFASHRHWVVPAAPRRAPGQDQQPLGVAPHPGGRVIV
jgi:crotonobetainyl-CoA:carnitine CoA-transferase CaiB-like acyl-CoA transferase